MRARLILPWFIALAGCSMDNPAFGDVGAETGLATDSIGTDPTTTGQDTTAPACGLGPGQPLKIELLAPSCNTDDPDSFDRYYELVAAAGDTLTVYSCPDGAFDCSACANGPGDLSGPLTFEPLNVDELAPPGTCLHVVARRTNPTNPAGCSFQTVIIEATSNGNRVPLLIGRNVADVGLPPMDGSSPLLGFDPIPKTDQFCDCAIYTDDCCNGVAPTVFAYDIGLPEPVKLGAVGELVFPIGTYEFKALDGFQPGMCDEPTRIAWGLVHRP